MMLIYLNVLADDGEWAAGLCLGPWARLAIFGLHYHQLFVKNAVRSGEVGAGSLICGWDRVEGARSYGSQSLVFSGAIALRSPFPQMLLNGERVVV